MLILISCVTHVGSHMLAILDNLTFYEFYLINFRNLTYQQIINFFLHVDIIILDVDDNIILHVDIIYRKITCKKGAEICLHCNPFIHLH